MGQGNTFTCSKCGHEYGFYEGIGFKYPQVYKETMRDVLDGKYGDRLKEAVGAADDPLVDATSYTYLCRKCGHWEVAPGLTVYSRISVESEIGGDLIRVVMTPPEEFARLWFPGDMTDFSHKAVARYSHKCPACGKRMHRATEEEKLHLKCPECGGEPDQDSIRVLMWD